MAASFFSANEPSKDDSLSDASLIEDEKMDETSSQASSIHLSGEAVTGSPAASAVAGQFSTDEDMAPFRGFTPKEISDSALKISVKKRLIDSQDEEFLNSNELMSKFASALFNANSEKDSAKAERSPQERTPKPLASPLTRDNRGWKPSAQFFKPLTSGWKREVIYGRDDDGNYSAKPIQIIYYSPPPAVGVPKSFQTLAELGHFLSSSAVSTLTLHNFSFRKEPMNAPKDQEIRRASDEMKLFPHPSPKKPSPSSGSLRQPFSHKPQVEAEKKTQDSAKIKVKTFSKMKEKNAINESSDGHVVAKHSNLPAAAALPESPRPPVKKSKSVLRPNNMNTEVVCSIHCEEASGPPALSCHDCHTMFHPVCVGLMEGPDYSGFDFYCASCSPPPGKESVEMPPPMPKKAPVSTAKFVSPSSAKTPSFTMPSLTQRMVPSPPLSQGFSGLKKRGRSSFPERKVLRPIESQAIVNISGTKYLVVPHPSPAPIAKKPRKSSENLLPLFLRPMDVDSAHPSFEIEESADGKMILLPVGGSGSKVATKAKPKICDKFSSDLSEGYSVMLKVFDYLSPAELLKVGLVCKLWYEMAHHHSLWTSFQLRKCKVRDWSGLARHLIRTRTANLDARKLGHLAGEEQAKTWSRFREIAPTLHFLKRIEMPKMPAKWVNDIIGTIKSSPISNLRAISASAITLKGDDVLDFAIAANIYGLDELKLKAFSGHLSVRNLDVGLESLPSTLTKLSLLSFDSLKSEHLDQIIKLSNLKALELGDCGFISQVIFSKLISLKNLFHLRLEKGSIGRDVGALEHVKKLEHLEFIDMELYPGFGEGFVKLRKLKKLLLIPHYKNEVAAVNSEIVDSALSMAGLTHFVLGLTNEWLELMGTMVDKDQTSPKRDNFPIMVNSVCEMFSLQKLLKTLSAALPSAHVKVLKMPSSSTSKQSVNR